MKLIGLIFAAVISGGAVAQPVDHLGADQAILLRWVQGQFSNERQRREISNALSESPPTAEASPDLLFPVFKRIDIPAFDGDVVYLQWAIGAPDGKLQRQRIWVFKSDPARNALVMKFYTLKNPEAWVDAHLNPEKVRGMTLDDVLGYPTACDVPYRRQADVFIGEIPRDQCRIVAQQNGIAMAINSRTIIGANKIWYQESGIADGSGKVVFQTPRVGAFEFDRR
jgi:hypothetical protein